MFSLHPPIARLKLSLRDRCVSSIKFLNQWPKSETFCERRYYRLFRAHMVQGMAQV